MDKSKSKEHLNELTTPDYIYDPLYEEFLFTIDVCATPENTKCTSYYTKEQDCLTKSWKGERVWLQPPYNNSVWQKFVRYAYNQVLYNGCETVVALVPAKTGVKVFHECIYDEKTHQYYPWAKVRFYKGRISFGDFKGSGEFQC
jgi:site-specific DNA-methyltransferase (adenine-specific)